MKKTFLALLFLIFTELLFSQSSVTEVNKTIYISDSLNFSKEIRIYKVSAITNFRTVFRLYQTNDKKWNAEFYKLNSKDSYEKSLLSPKSNFNFTWLKILNSNIEYIANWESIEYKLKRKRGIKLENGEYVATWTMQEIMDGERVVVMINNQKRLNLVDYPNPNIYFNDYPDIDELESFMELLNFIDSEFKIPK